MNVEWMDIDTENIHTHTLKQTNTFPGFTRRNREIRS